MHVRTFLSTAAFAAVLHAGAIEAGPVGSQLIVPGSANPNLADRAGGYTCCGGDSSPPQSPPEVTGLELMSCDTLTFTVTGKVSFTSSVSPGNNPDGDTPFDMTNFGDGISAPNGVRANALYGVFLGDESPTGMETPARLDFTSALDFTNLSPEVGQIFFIGDGLTTDSNAGQTGGAPQFFEIPPGATRLFLGTGDGVGWFNNSGSFTVDVGKLDTAPDRGCGDAADPAGLTATDALIVLRAAVGTSLCPECICDVNRSSATTATDSLAVLRRAVGQDVTLLCDCCDLA
ncbi:MAG TPA: hypothetical protein VEL28_00285 [Candidatus Binatia bacterium]|nr:hypothetical protein [Candidatus Binatia bacterium]